MSETARCVDFLRGRRSANRKDEVVTPVEVEQLPRRHGGGEVVGRFTCAAGYF